MYRNDEFREILEFVKHCILLFLGLYINEIAGKPVLHSLRSG